MSFNNGQLVTAAVEYVAIGLAALVTGRVLENVFKSKPPIFSVLQLGLMGAIFQLIKSQMQMETDKMSIFFAFVFSPQTTLIHRLCLMSGMDFC